MKLSFNKTISLLLTAVMLLSTLPSAAFAEGGEPVRIRETGDVYETLEDAVAAANGMSSATIEILGDVSAATKDDIIITSSVTIVGAEGEHTVTLNKRIIVQTDGIIALGDGSETNTLTIKGTVRVEKGTLDARDGIIISAGTALILSGPDVSGAISGGRYEGYDAGLSLEKGAKLTEISGGVFTGRVDAVHITDAGTEIIKITDGEFYQVGAYTGLHGHAVFVQNESKIGEISGGYFEAEANSAMTVIRGAWIDEISGGEFVANRYGTIANNDRNAAVWIEGETKTTGIGTISGGHFDGTNFGVLAIIRDAQAQIDKITGGTFEGVVALQNDVNCIIGEISGGEIIGNQGMLNAGKIGEIGGDVSIIGETSYAIYNYAGGTIDKISGGTIVSNAAQGIANPGIITLISGGTIIGSTYAIRCSSNGKIGTITDGVFWGKGNYAIELVSELILEPGLNAEIGFGRYWSGHKTGQIFNDDKLVKYPGDYFMSTRTKPVEGITETEFKYLTLGELTYIVTFDTNGGEFKDGEKITTREVPPPKSTVGNEMPLDPTRKGYTFLGWNTKQEGTGTAFTAETKVIADITVYAQWKENGGGGGTKPPSPVSVTLEAKKAVTGDGAALKAGQFSFAVYSGSTIVAEGKNDGNGNIIFKAIEYDKQGTYSYTIKETSTDGNGWTTDKTEYSVTVKVTSSGSALSAEVTYSGGEPPTFTNKYERPEPEATSTLMISKSLVDESGKAAGNGLKFTVVLYERTEGEKWTKLGEYTIAANGTAVEVPGLKAKTTYQLVEKTNGWYKTLGFKITVGSTVQTAGGESVAFTIPSQAVTIEAVVQNEIVSTPTEEEPG